MEVEDKEILDFEKAKATRRHKELLQKSDEVKDAIESAVKAIQEADGTKEVVKAISQQAIKIEQSISKFTQAINSLPAPKVTVEAPNVKFENNEEKTVASIGELAKEIKEGQGKLSADIKELTEKLSEKKTFEISFKRDGYTQTIESPITLKQK